MVLHTILLLLFILFLSRLFQDFFKIRNVGNLRSRRLSVLVGVDLVCVLFCGVFLFFVTLKPVKPDLAYKTLQDTVLQEAKKTETETQFSGVRFISAVASTADTSADVASTESSRIKARVAFMPFIPARVSDFASF